MMNTQNLRFPLLVVMVHALCLTGCVAPAPIVDPSLFAVLDSQPGQSALSGDLFTRLPGDEIVFDIIAGDGAGSSITITRAEATRFNAQWEDDENGNRTEFLRTADGGDTVLIAAIDREDSAISLFNPPLIAAYAALAYDQPRTQEVTMRVVDLDNPRQQRESGTATQTIEYLGRRTVRTSAGDIVADCVSIHFEATLRMAKATSMTTYYLHDNGGVVAMEREESITALGMLIRSLRQTLLRRDLAALLD